jgi:hypothetical protein
VKALAHTAPTVSITLSGTADASKTVRATSVPFSPTQDTRVLVFKVTHSGTGSGRMHETFISVHNGTRVIDYDGCYVPDNSTGTGVAGHGIGALIPGSQYICVLESDKFTQGETAQFTVELLDLDTNLNTVANDVLQKAEAGTDHAAVTFGIPEGLVNELCGLFTFPRPVFPVGPQVHLSVDVAPDSPPLVKFDSANKWVVFQGGILLRFFPTSTPSAIAASVEATLMITAEPVMATGSADYLQFQFKTAMVTVAPQISIQSQDEILQGYPTIQAFKDDVTSILNHIANKEGQYATVLPLYVSTRPLPDLWNRISFYDVTPLPFDYRTVTTHGEDVGYLFPVFAVRSNKIPVPCYCDQHSARAERVADGAGKDRGAAPTAGRKLKTTSAGTKHGSFSTVRFCN